MWKRHLSFSVSYGLIAMLYLIVELLNIAEARFLVKPLICLILTGYLVSRTRLYGHFSKLIFGGLLFSLAGDVALLFADTNATFFLIGLIAFLIAHVFYSIAFFRDYRYDPMGSKKYGNMIRFIMAAFTVGFYIFIRSYLNDMKIPVMAYMVIISIMVIMAGFRYQRVNLLSFQLILAGAILFVISDTLLAINKFVQHFESSGVLIIATYMLAQYLITMGALDRVVPVKGKIYS